MLCVSSDRYALHLGDSVPRLPVPQRDLVYRIYGYTASAQGRGAKHARRCAEYRGGAVSRLAAATTYRNKLTDKKLQSVMTCGSFSRLQVLSDVAEAFGVGMVQLPRSFGPGVRFDAAPLKLKELAEVRDRLNQSGEFRAAFGGSAAVCQTGHLICEARQYVWGGMQPAALTHFFGRADLSGSRRLSRREAEVKREHCRSIAEFTPLFGVLRKHEPVQREGGCNTTQIQSWFVVGLREQYCGW